MSIKNIHNNQKVLIIGAKGNLGQQLVKASQNNFEVFIWDIEDIDVTDENQINEKIKDLKPSIIINAAAYNAVDKCEEDEEEFELAKKINGLASGYLAKVALNIGAILVHYSSDYVFDGEKKEGYVESDEPNPISKYGQTKLIGEQEILNYQNQNLKYYIIRTSKLFGPKGISVGAKDSFFDIMLKLGRENEEVKVVDEEESCFTYTPDLAQVTLDLIKQKKEYGIYHITNSDSCTWHQAVLELFKISNIDIKVIPVLANEFARPARRPKYSVLLNTKLEPLRSYKEALREYLKNK